MNDLSAEDVCEVIAARVREIRANLELTMSELAERSGLSIGMLSKIENGQTSPSITTLTAIANAAEVPLTALFRGLEEEQDAIVVRSGEGAHIDHLGASPTRTYRDLGALRGPKRIIEPVLITIAEADEVFPLFQHPGIEFIHVLEGMIEYGYGAKRYRLSVGDTIQIQGDVAHGPVALLELPIRMLSLKVYPAE